MNCTRLVSNTANSKRFVYKTHLCKHFPPPPRRASEAADEFQAGVDQLQKFVARFSGSAPEGKLLVLTGAGISTPSGIPDYRGANGSYTKGHIPMNHAEFISSGVEGERARKRYWARNFFGFEAVSGCRPNKAHTSLARFQTQAFETRPVIVTQNVDRLHHRALADMPLGLGSWNQSFPEYLLELHGTVWEIICLDCGFREKDRGRMQEELIETNAEWLRQINYNPQRIEMRADGDATVAPKSIEDSTRQINTDDFEPPRCPKCSSSRFKPDVVFFGDNMPKHRLETVRRHTEEAAALLVVGSSLQVLSAFRIVKTIRERLGDQSIFILNNGVTRLEEEARLGMSKVARSEPSRNFGRIDGFCCAEVLDAAISP